MAAYLFTFRVLREKMENKEVVEEKDMSYV
jgi:hypothetical protein